MGVVSVGQHLFILAPARLMSLNIMSETRCNLCVEDLDLAVDRAVICRRGEMLNTQTDSDCCEELCHELQSVLSEKMGWNIVQHSSTIHNSDC